MRVCRSQAQTVILYQMQNRTQRFKNRGRNDERHVIIFISKISLIDYLGFEPRTGEEHRHHACEWRDEEDEKEREHLFEENGCRWFEFSCLNYFDPVRMTIIDPMNDILLGMF